MSSQLQRPDSARLRHARLTTCLGHVGALLLLAPACSNSNSTGAATLMLRAQRTNASPSIPPPLPRKPATRPFPVSEPPRVTPPPTAPEAPAVIAQHDDSTAADSGVTHATQGEVPVATLTAPSSPPPVDPTTYLGANYDPPEVIAGSLQNVDFDAPEVVAGSKKDVDFDAPEEIAGRADDPAFDPPESIAGGQR